MTSATSTSLDADAEPPEPSAAEGAPPAPVDRPGLRRAVDVLVVAASALFVFWQLHPDLLLAETTPAGGDMGAHVWAFAHLRDHLLPDLRLSGWAPDWYAGFPVFQFYMVVPFLAMVALNAGLGGPLAVLPAAGAALLSARAAGSWVRPGTLLAIVAVASGVLVAAGAVFGYGPTFDVVLIASGVASAAVAGTWGRHPRRRALALAAVALVVLGVAVPYGPAFKLVSVAGVVAMPVSAYAFGRLTRLPHPTPALLSVATLAFLFDTSFTIYGGNVASTLAGEFAFSISLALAILYLGVLVRGLRTGEHRAAAAVLLALVGLCHLIPAFVALGATVVLLAVHVLAEPAPDGGEGRRTAAGGGALGALVLLVAATALVLDVASVGPIVLVTVASLAVLGLLFLARVGSDPDAGGGPVGLRRTWWLLSIGVVAALLAAWWVLPFFWRRTYVNDMGWEKIAVHAEGTALWSWFTDQVWPALVPSDLRIYAALALVGAVLSVAFRSRIGVALVVLGIGLALAFVLLPQGRLWNARLLPFWYLVVYWLAAVGVGEVARAVGQLLSADPRRPRPVATLVAAPLALLLVGGFLGGQLRNLPTGSTNADGSYRILDSIGIPGLASLDLPDAVGIDVSGRNFATDWARWNYSGYEGKDAYPEYRGIVATMAEVGERNGCGRSLWEYSPDLNDYGTPMALMLLPHWTDGCIGSMEGLYFEASSTTPFHFLVQSELSKEPSRAQRDMPYRELDVDAGVDPRQLLGVRYYLARSPEAKAAAAGHGDLALVATDGPWEVYEVAGSDLVEPLSNEPVVTTAAETQDEWLGCKEGHPPCPGVALDWFQDPARWDVPVAASGPEGWARVEPGGDVPATPVPEARVADVDVDDTSISFTVDRPGTPVLVKASYFPNWTADGADGPYRVAPNLMVVVPTDTDVVLRYSRTPVDWLAIALTLLGVAGAVALARRPGVAVRPLRDPSGTTASP
ncbi:MAG: hypothetical protein ACLGIC_09920 [Acidimicrobiia bacterium]